VNSGKTAEELAMTSLHLYGRDDNKANQQQQEQLQAGRDRRQHRRHDLEQQSIRIDRWDGSHKTKVTFGKLVDLSAGGVRIRTEQPNLKPDHQIRVRLELPAYAGICPFVDTSGNQPQPKREWTGWMTVARVQPVSEREYDVAGRLVDMEDLDRGMLGLYLSTQPLAA
jgi:hypothetical protein